MSEIQTVIRKLVELDVGFYAKHDTPSGQATVHLSGEDLVAYAADTVGFLAKHYGVSKADYLGWHESNYCVICASKTVKGKACKATVTGLSMVENPRVWAEHQGAYCFTHGGPGTSEVDRSERFR